MLSPCDLLTGGEIEEHRPIHNVHLATLWCVKETYNCKAEGLGHITCSPPDNSAHRRQHLQRFQTPQALAASWASWLCS